MPRPRNNASTRHSASATLDDLRSRIVAGEFEPGARLPTTKELGERYGVSVVTMNKCIGRLKDEGLVNARARAGIFVSDPLIRPRSVPEGSTKRPTIVVFAVRRQLDLLSPSALSAAYLTHLYDEAVMGAQEQAELQGMDSSTVVLPGQLWDDRERARDYVCTQAQGADGVVYVGSTYVATDLLLECAPGPAVFAPAALSTTGGNKVDLDHYPTARLVMEHLVDRGHKRLATLSGAPDKAFATRDKAYRDVLRAHSLATRNEYVITSTEDASDIERAIDQFLAIPKKRRPDAVFCMNDLRAMMLVKRLQSAGIDVPGDVAVAGFDGNPDAIRMGITTGQTPFHQVGAQAVLMLSGILSKRLAPPCHSVISGGIVTGSTT
jgi:DNA-binding LacI/PurR family transcriptional regulator